MLPTLIIFAGIVAGMYWGGLGYAEVPTTLIQAPIFETTDIELNSLDSIFDFRFYCNSLSINVSIPLTPKDVARPVTYFPVPEANTSSPIYGCSALASRGYQAVYIF
jgi:hypothetical protein